MRAILIAAALLAAAPAAQALEPADQPPAAAPATAFERDRQAILAQAGQYRVHFDMRENVSFRADYYPLEEKLSGGSEIVGIGTHTSSDFDPRWWDRLAGSIKAADDPTPMQP